MLSASDAEMSCWNSSELRGKRAQQSATSSWLQAVSRDVTGAYMYPFRDAPVENRPEEQESRSSQMFTSAGHVMTPILTDGVAYSLAQCPSIRKTLVTASWICRGHKARQKTYRELLQQWLNEFGGAAASPAVTVPVTALSGGC